MYYHICTDVNIAKSYMRWRTALIVREVEEEVIAMDRGRQAYACTNLIYSTPSNLI